MTLGALTPLGTGPVNPSLLHRAGAHPDPHHIHGASIPASLLAYFRTPLHRKLSKTSEGGGLHTLHLLEVFSKCGYVKFMSREAFDFKRVVSR